MADQSGPVPSITQIVTDIKAVVTDITATVTEIKTGQYLEALSSVQNDLLAVKQCLTDLSELLGNLFPAPAPQPSPTGQS